MIELSDLSYLYSNLSDSAFREATGTEDAHTVIQPAPTGDDPFTDCFFTQATIPVKDNSSIWT
jgi:hypothetical protein